MADKKRSGVYWFAGALLVFILSYINSATAGVAWDESWFLQVVHRVRSGDVLYRDVFCGVTPLSVYVGEALTRMLGTEIWVVKAFAVLCFTLAVFLSHRIARQLDSAKGFPLLIVALLVFARQELVSLYSPLADVLLLACFSVALSWIELEKKRPGPGNVRVQSAATLTLAGAAAGLCFCAKQNIGLAASGALMLTVALDSRSRQHGLEASLKAVFWVLAGFCAVGLVVLAPVWLSGGIGKLLEYGFLAKGAYIRYAHVSYLQGIRETMGFDPSKGVIYNLAGIYVASLFLLPLLAAAGLFIAWRNATRDERSRAAAVSLFAGAALMGVYPIANMAHLKDAIPMLAIAVAYAWHRTKPCLSRRWALLVTTGVAAGLIPGLYLLLWVPLARIEQPTELATLPHSRGVLIGTTTQTNLFRFRSSLAEATDGKPVFFVSRYAGFYYLITGAKNPTPFDFPYSTAFGLKGQEEVVVRLSQGQIPYLCIDTTEEPSAPLFPQLIRAFAEHSMQRYRKLGICTLYRAR